MINGKDLNRCIDILSELNANTTNRRDKQLILELGYIIKQELDLVKEWEKTHNREAMRLSNTQAIDVNKLLEDNAQLYKENETLMKNLATLNDIIASKLPIVQQDLATISNKFDILNHYLDNNLC